MLRTTCRKFREVFNAAQVELRSVFGMEMIELPSRERYGVSEKRKGEHAAVPQDLFSVLISGLSCPKVSEPGRQQANNHVMGPGLYTASCIQGPRRLAADCGAIGGS